MNKKIISVIILGFICATAAACNNNDNSTSSINSTSSTIYNSTPSVGTSSNPSISTSTPSTSTGSTNSTTGSNISTQSSTTSSQSSTTSSTSSPGIDPVEVENTAKGYFAETIPAIWTESFTLPDTVPGFDFEVEWKSYNTDVLLDDGTIIAPIDDTAVNLRATFTYNNEPYYILVEVIVAGYSDEKRLEISAANLQEPVINYYNRTVDLPTTDIYGVTIVWSVTGSPNIVVKSGNQIVVSPEAFEDGDSFRLTAHITLGEATKTVDFEYKMPVTTKNEPVEISVDSVESFSWTRLENARSYLVEFPELDKEYQVFSPSFSLSERFIPTNSQYKVIVTPTFDGIEVAPPSEGIVGHISNLPKIAAPEILLTNPGGDLKDSYKDPDTGETIPATYHDRITALNWEIPTGATHVRVYSDGYLFKTIPISTSYNLIANGIITQRLARDYKVTVQFVGNYVEYQSSDLIEVKFSSVGNGSGCNVPEEIKVENGTIKWKSVAYPNGGYILAFNDFLLHYGPAVTNAINSRGIEELDGIPYGTYENVRVKAISDSNGTPSAFSTDSTKVTILPTTISGPANVEIGDENILTWDSIPNAVFYSVTFQAQGFTTIVDRIEGNTSIDLNDRISNNIILPNTYTISIYALIAVENGATKTEVTTINWEYVVAATQLEAPTILSGNYQEFTWTEIEGAVGYLIKFISIVPATGVKLAEVEYQSLTNTFNFVDNNLMLNYNYEVKVCALAQNSRDNSTFSSSETFTTSLTNVALLSKGASVQIVAGKDGVNDGLIINSYDGDVDGSGNPKNSGNFNNDRLLDGNAKGNNWQNTALATLLGVSSNSNQRINYLEVTITLDGVYNVSQLVSYWAANRSPYKYTVEISLDGENWTNVYTYDDNTKISTARCDVISFDELTPMKYMRVNCTQRQDTNYTYSIFGFHVNVLPSESNPIN